MNTCAGCGYALTTGAETFGPVGQAFCQDCYAEDLELQPLRKELERERLVLEEEMSKAKTAWADADDRHSYIDAFTAEQDYDSAAERLEDVEEELSCLIVQYQRRTSVIGRAA